MGDSKRRLQYAKPFLLAGPDDSQGQFLTRMKLSAAPGGDKDKYDELWLQRLLHRHPRSLPVTELEPGFGEVIPIAMEMPTPAGSVDNVLVTTDGNIALLECKLWRNPEARRRVIAQIIDYAQSMSRWTYQDFDAAVGKSQDANGQPVKRPLIDIVVGATGDREEVDEPTFIDAIQHNLRMGRMLLLVVGDGVREDVEGLARYLQKHAGFHFTLGLVEIAIFALPVGGKIVQPRILARTLNIERAIVRLAGVGLAAEPIEVSEPERPASTSLTEELFFEKLSAKTPETVKALKSFLDLAQEDRVFLRPASRSASLRWESVHGRVFTLGQVDLEGKLQSYAVGWEPANIGHIELAHEYLQKLATLVGGLVQETLKPSQWYVAKKPKTPPPALDALNKPEEWLSLMREYQAALNTATGDKPE